MTKAEAINKVLMVIKNRMAMASKPMMEEAYACCAEYALTARDLLERQDEILKNT
jgi:hypothetical protein